MFEGINIRGYYVLSKMGVSVLKNIMFVMGGMFANIPAP